jgi:hypothetical protein
MRKAFDRQQRMDRPTISNVPLNLGCRDEIIPILAALKHIYAQPKLRDDILQAVARDVNRDSSRKRGRRGMDYWPILVLASVRLGCNFDYDRLQDLAEQHRALRQMMGLGDWNEEADFNWRTIRNNITLLRPETLERINHAIVAEGHRLLPEAAETVRGGSFVADTNIHYPTDSSLIRDGLPMSLDGGLEDVEESLRAAANCCFKSATSARSRAFSSSNFAFRSMTEESFFSSLAMRWARRS